MLPAINFYNDFEHRTIEIDDIISKYILAIKLITTIP